MSWNFSWNLVGIMSPPIPYFARHIYRIKHLIKLSVQDHVPGHIYINTIVFGDHKDNPIMCSIHGTSLADPALIKENLINALMFTLDGENSLLNLTTDLVPITIHWR